MIGGRKPSPQPDDPLPAVPACPTCGTAQFVRQEHVITGRAVITFWGCASCLRSWPAPPVRMKKADLRK